MSRDVSSLNQLLRQQLLIARQLDERASILNATGPMIDVPHTGTALSSAYEQLRNAAEYAEEHLLLQRAIKRFCKRKLFLSKYKAHDIGTELVVELVQAGYLHGGSFGHTTANSLERLVERYLTAFGHLRQARVPRDLAMDWTLALISCQAENMLNPHHSQQALVFFAYQHYLQAIPRDRFEDEPEAAANYEFCLYIAVHQALLKSDIDTVRHELIELYQQTPEDIAGFKHLNQQVNHHFTSPLTQQLKRVISRNGAPLRVLKSMIHDRPETAELLIDKDRFMDAYSWHITREYSQVSQRLSRGIRKSIIFLLISKAIVGIAIEVPYDLLAHGRVAIAPLAVNLLFPVLYMMSLSPTLRPPAPSGAQPLRAYVDQLLFGPADLSIHVPARRVSRLRTKFVYFLMFFVPLIITVFILQKIGFNTVQMIIFFIFFSTASFLGFRLSSHVRELELKIRRTGLLASFRDFFYLPFIMVGQWLSRKYGSINAVARILDVTIELPLKAVLRLLRQWIRFINDKHEQLY